ncbi:ferredoxin [Nocardia salmonicida]|uniref:ferredoxin n=1 Tax=Nocardia salmonicida TaxID=53431 RepID=UPI00378C2FB3
MKLRLDSTRCQGHTLCAMNAPESFRLDDLDGHGIALSEDVPVEHEDQVREAALSCPEQAISLR